MKRPRAFDANLIVIGAGSAGLIAALVAATVKAKVILIERGAMGGDCLNTGCVPSKSLIASARVARTIAGADAYGIRGAAGRVDFAAVMDRVQRVIAAIAPNDSVERYTALGVDCVQGDAQLVDPWTVTVSGRRYTARSIVIATGAVPVVPPIPGLAEAAPLTSENVWSLRAQPARLLVMGAGPIGCELAQSFQRLGSRVTLLDMAERILPKEDADVAELVADVLRGEGVELLTGHRAVRVEGGSPEEGAGAEKVLVATHADGERRIAFDEVLVAVGRRPSHEGLGLEALGLATNADGTLRVDEYLRTSQANVFACGDAAGPYQFTHMASHQAWYAAVNALFGGIRRFKVNYAVVPWCTYTEPEVARVGLSEDDARARGIAFEVARHPLSHVDRALADGTTEGFIKVLTPPRSDRILGAVIVAPNAGDLLAEYVLAMTHGIGLKGIQGAIHVYPTLAELNKSAANAWRRAHAPEWALRLAGRFHALFR
jgi:pyruvate/2-oxoglutarate dehydrogenase complex dihydrolipoamide dehydrogenase (E3) component